MDDSPDTPTGRQVIESSILMFTDRAQPWPAAGMDAAVD
jgi:hypothetical protein